MMEYNVEDYLYLVDKTIEKKHYNGRLFKKNLKLEKEDVRQIGMIGLIKGLNNYDKSKGQKLKNHLISYINYELLKEYRDNDYLVNFSREVKRIGIECNKLEINNISEIVNRFKCSNNIAKQALYYKDFLSNELISFDNENNNMSLLEIFGQDYNLEDYVIRKIEFEKRLSILNDRQKEILLYTLEGKTQREISKILGIAQKNVNKHFKNAINKIEKYNKEENKIA